MRTNRYILVIGLVIRSFLVSAQPLTLHYDRPARYFEEALVIGNGSLGATVYGRTDFEQISLNDITLWTGEPDTKVYSPEAWRNLADIRDALNKEDYRLADRLQRKVQGHYSENYQPLGSLIIHYLDDDGVTPSITDYRRSLDISQAIATTTYKRNGVPFKVEYFCSAPDSVIVVHIKSEKPFTASLRLDSQLPHTTSIDDLVVLSSDGYVAYHSRPNYTDGKFFYEENRGMRFRTSVAVVDSHVRSYLDGDSLLIFNSKEATICISNVTSFNGFDKNPVTQGRDYKSEGFEANGYTEQSFNDEGELENVASNEDFSDDFDSEGSFDEE